MFHGAVKRKHLWLYFIYIICTFRNSPILLYNNLSPIYSPLKPHIEYIIPPYFPLELLS